MIPVSFRSLSTCVLAAVVLLFVSCANQTMLVPSVAQPQPRAAVQEDGDTTTCVIAFSDQSDRQRFVKAFRAFVDKYPFGAFKTDTVDKYLHMTLMPVRDTTGAAPLSMDLETVDQAHIVESVIESATDSALGSCIERGGTATLYSPRPFWDEQFLTLVAPSIPFGPSRPDREPGFETVFDDTAVPGSPDPGRPLFWEQVNDTRIRVTLAPGRPLSGQAPFTAFELVQCWTDLIRERPADGTFAFQNVKGVAGFVAGREAVVAGFVVVDEQTMEIRLTQPDSRARMRMNSALLVPMSLGAGNFSASAGPANSQRLVATSGGNACMDSLVVVLGGDKEPFLNFSLGRYDVLVLREKNDLEYARTKMRGKADLIPLDRDRYFLSVRSTPELKAVCSRVVSPVEFLNAAARCEGSVVPTLAVPAETVPGSTMPAPENEVVSETVTILYLSQDRVSAALAEKLFADLTRVSVDAKLDGRAMRAYQQALVSGGYSVAIGWVAEKELKTDRGLLRTAALWFDGETDETTLLQQRREIPLFAAQWYALIKRPLALDDAGLAGLHPVVQ